MHMLAEYLNKHNSLSTVCMFFFRAKQQFICTMADGKHTQNQQWNHTTSHHHDDHSAPVLGGNDCGSAVVDTYLC